VDSTRTAGGHSGGMEDTGERTAAALFGRNRMHRIPGSVLRSGHASSPSASRSVVFVLSSWL
jgi:hypothetical protein